MNKATEKIIQQMKDKWPSAVVAREQVGLFTGGMIKPKTMANLDWRREGPSMTIKTSGKVG